MIKYNTMFPVELHNPIRKTSNEYFVINKIMFPRKSQTFRKDTFKNNKTISCGTPSSFVHIIRSSEDFELDFKCLDKQWVSLENSQKGSGRYKIIPQMKEQLFNDVKRLRYNIEFFK